MNAAENVLLSKIADLWWGEGKLIPGRVNGTCTPGGESGSGFRLEPASLEALLGLCSVPWATYGPLPPAGPPSTIYYQTKTKGKKR